ncbi:MAG: hypothetical protein ACT4N2_07100 [Hyphomicrobium sp.]
MEALSVARLSSASRPQSRRGNVQGRSQMETIQYRFIFAIAFLVFLVTSTLERILPSGKSAASARLAADRPSLFSRARESAHICAAYAFMG